MLVALGYTRSQAQITLDTSNANLWAISNGALMVKWLPGNGRITSIRWSAVPDQELIDQTNRDRNGPKGFNMDNAGSIGGSVTPHFFLDPDGNYIDFWVAHAADSVSPFTWSWHNVLFANDPGVHVYFVLDHGPGDGVGSIGQIQWVFRGDLTQLVNTFSVNTGLDNLGATTVPLPDAVLFGTGLSSGRNVQDATSDLHGLPLPTGYRRQFYTKYDYSSYEYLHKAEGVYGSTLGAWMVVPSTESLTGGPTKQDLIFTGNLLIMEAFSNHLDNQIDFTVSADAVAHRLYGPFYLHFNQFSPDFPSPASLYHEALSAGRAIKPAYDGETVLLNSGYAPSTDRGEVHVQVKGAKRLNPNQGWAVLSDPNTNFQYTHAGREYWTSIDHEGTAHFHGVAPGTYRLSVYALGAWGELRLDGVEVNAQETTRVSLRFTHENFGSASPIWTIGRPDRSSHEFLHGQITNPPDLVSNHGDDIDARPGNVGHDDGEDRGDHGDDFDDEFVDRRRNRIQDDREYWGNWNYWADFAPTNGAVIYHATAVGSTPATNDLTKWNYNQWRIFNPGLFAGVFNPADQTTDGYKFICPSFVGNCATARVPDWQVHFTTTAHQQAQGPFVVLSVGLAATESNLTASLNGNPLTWHGLGIKNADAAVRSGFSGTYQWVVFEWNTSQLAAPGEDNVITFHVDHTQGVMYDALRMEITAASAAHEATGWNDYEYLNSAKDEPANDSISNNSQSSSISQCKTFTCEPPHEEEDKERH
jgi:hypothetical protein